MAEESLTIRVPPDKAVKIAKWKVKEGVFISRGQIILLYNAGESADDAKKLKASDAGTVVRLLAKEGDTVEAGAAVAQLEACRHAAAVRGLCAACGRPADSAAAIGVPVLHAAPEVRVSAAEALRIGTQDARRLLAARRLALLLDLDQTLVHTTDFDVPPNLKNVYHFQLGGPPPQPVRWYHTRTRPYTKRFLNNMSELFELHVCTFGARAYAHSVAGHLDPNQSLFHQRILSRDECFDARTKSANLKALFPCGDSLVCIVDDREDVWLHAPNLVHVKPYIYFPNIADIHAPPPRENNRIPKSNAGAKESEKQPSDKNKTDENEKEAEVTNAPEPEKGKEEPEISDKINCVEVPLVAPSLAPAIWKETEDGTMEIEDDDDYLLYLEDILKRIHSKFYELYDQDTEKVPDLKKVVPLVKSASLQGLSLAFSGLVRRPRSVRDSRAARVARGLGARVLTDEEEQNATHLVAAKSGTLKVNRARRKVPPVHVVTPSWLWACAERWERVEEACYPLPLHGHLQSHERKPPAHCSPPHSSSEWRLAAESPEEPPENFMDSLNPLLSFSRDDIANMDKEVEDIFNESDESDSEKKETSKTNSRRPADKKSSSSDSESEEIPSKKSRIDKTEQKEIQKNEEEEKEAESEDEDGDGEEDVEWSDMGAALEREFLSL